MIRPITELPLLDQPFKQSLEQHLIIALNSKLAGDDSGLDRLILVSQNVIQDSLR